MFKDSEEWEGAKSHKFQGSKRILKDAHRQEFSFSTANLPCVVTRLEQVKSKRHFICKQSDSLPDWKPCVRIYKSSSQYLQPVKITELPCTTQLKPLRHVEKFVKNRVSGIKTHTLWNKTLQGFKFQEAQADVRGLEKWENEVLNKKVVLNNFSLRHCQSRLAN